MKLNYAEQDIDVSNSEPFIILAKTAAPEPKDTENITLHIASIERVSENSRTIELSFAGKVINAIAKRLQGIKAMIRQAKEAIKETNREVIEQRKRYKLHKQRETEAAAPMTVSAEISTAILAEKKAIEEIVPERIVTVTRSEDGTLLLTDHPKALEHVSILITNGKEAGAEQAKNKKLAREISFVLTGLEKLAREKSLSKQSLREAIKEQHETLLQMKTAEKILASIEEALYESR